jgi:hypothetical protein
VLIVRIFAASAFGLVLVNYALAQTDSAAPTTPTPPAAGSTFQSVMQQHPDWFTTRRPYFPCQASVGFNGHGACLGCPTICSQHY